VFSTGVSDQNQALAGTQVDPHYRLIATPETRTPGPTAYTAPSSVRPISGPWLAEDSTSRWLLPERVWLGNAVTYLWPGTYKYRTEFLIAGYDPATVTLSGKWAADNSGRILVNGQTVNTIAGSAGQTAWTSFTVTGSPLRAGVNLIDFEVTNADTLDSPTGLRVEFNPPTASSTLSSDFIITPVSRSRTAVINSLTPFGLNITRINHAQAITITASLPGSVSQPTTTGGSDTSTTVNVGSSQATLPPGTPHTVTLTATSGSLTRVIEVELNVLPSNVPIPVTATGSAT
jgi:hypothetical protein